MTSQHDIVIAVRPRTAITRLPEDIMASPYLNHVRSAREIIEELIIAREIELAKTSAAVQRQRIEADLCQRAPKFPQKWAVKIPWSGGGFGLGDQP